MFMKTCMFSETDIWLIVSMLAINSFINKPRQNIKYGEAVSMVVHYQDKRLIFLYVPYL